jgi:hypothetical protein
MLDQWQGAGLHDERHVGQLDTPFLAHTLQILTVNNKLIMACCWAIGREHVGQLDTPSLAHTLQILAVNNQLIMTWCWPIDKEAGLHDELHARQLYTSLHRKHSSVLVRYGNNQ